MRDKTRHCRTVVVGNEAADLDSVVSSLCYAYLHSIRSGTAAVALINCTRSDFVLRTEILYLLSLSGISPDDLLFIDTVNLPALLQNAELILVDHNQPGVDWISYSSRISAIIDHHKDAGLFRNVSPRIIRTVGSTATLIAEEFMRHSVHIDRDVASLLLAAIILDTQNLSPQLKKATAADGDAVTALLALAPLDREALFLELQRRRFTVDGMSGSELLRRDYKEYQSGDTRYGIAVIYKDLAGLLTRDRNFFTAVEHCRKERELELLAVMLVFMDSGFRRELLVSWENGSGQDRFCELLQENGFALSPLSLESVTAGIPSGIRVYHQGEESCSRKVLAPVLAAFFSRQ